MNFKTFSKHLSNRTTKLTNFRQLYHRCKNSEQQTENTLKNRTEYGRSMVEMLGVLAVIGILSVSGIIGYRMAMNKYHANQIMNNARMRLMSLEMQLERDVDDINLDEWEETANGYRYSIVYDEDDALLLSISTLSKNVCQLVVQGLENNYEIEIGNENGDELEECSDDNENVVYVYVSECRGWMCFEDKLPIPLGGLPCPHGISDCYFDGMDQACLACENGPCKYHAKDKQACGDGNNVCFMGECRSVCRNDSDCKVDEYCATTGGCNKVPLGCKKLDFVKKTIVVNGQKEVWYAAFNQHVYFDNAVHMCQRIGKKMIEFKDLSSETQIKGSWKQYQRNERALALYEAFSNSSGYWNTWINEEYDCSRAYLFNISTGGSSPSWREYDGYAVLCH